METAPRKLDPPRQIISVALVLFSIAGLWLAYNSIHTYAWYGSDPVLNDIATRFSPCGREFDANGNALGCSPHEGIEQYRVWGPVFLILLFSSLGFYLREKMWLTRPVFIALGLLFATAFFFIIPVISTTSTIMLHSGGDCDGPFHLKEYYSLSYSLFGVGVHGGYWYPVCY